MLVVYHFTVLGCVEHGCDVGLNWLPMPGKIIKPTLSSDLRITFSTLWIEYSAHWNRVGLLMPGTPVQLLSVSLIEPVASSTNIKFSDWALPPALAADAVEWRAKELRP